VLTASEIAAQIERGEIAWRGDLRGDGLLLRLGSPLQLLADPGHVIDLANQASIDTLYTQALHGWDECELAPGQMALCAAAHPLMVLTCICRHGLVSTCSGHRRGSPASTSAASVPLSTA
jgi:hypothetical protein